VSGLLWIRVVPDPFSSYNVIVIFYCRGSGDVLFSRDTLLPLFLIVPLRYHGTTPKPPAKTSSASGTRSADLTGSGMASFTQRRTTDADHQNRLMAQVTLTTNGQTVTIDGELSAISSILSGLQFNDSLQQSNPIVAANNEPAELAPFNAFLTVELTPYFGASGASMIVTKLKRCRAIGDFRYFIPIYKMANDDLQKRQLLKVVSAVYRYKFGGYRNPEQYSLRSEIKYAKACHECGALAQVLADRLIAEGLWK